MMGVVHDYRHVLWFIAAMLVLLVIMSFIRTVAVFT